MVLLDESRSTRKRFSFCLFAWISTFVKDANGFVAPSTISSINSATVPKASKTQQLGSWSWEMQAVYDDNTSISVREWKIGEGPQILDLLLSAEDGSFNPEGSLEVDCLSESSLKESYPSEDGGCFVVAQIENNDEENEIVGVGGLIVGTPVQYQTSGSSISSGDVTAAIRRCCYRSSTKNGKSLSPADIQCELYMFLENRAVQAGATNLIALAYPQAQTISTISNSGSYTSSGDSKVFKPSPQNLESLGYKVLPQQIPGIDAIQYGKDLLQRQEMKSTENESNSELIGVNRRDDSPASSLLVQLIALTIPFILVGFWGIAQFIGFDTTFEAPMIGDSMTVNRGLGRPLSKEDLGQLLEDEELKRTTLDENTSSREWNDLSPEEQKEELALLRIISGQDVRVN